MPQMVYVVLGFLVARSLVVKRVRLELHIISFDFNTRFTGALGYVVS